MSSPFYVVRRVTEEETLYLRPFDRSWVNCDCGRFRALAKAQQAAVNIRPRPTDIERHICWGDNQHFGLRGEDQIDGVCGVDKPDVPHSCGHS